MANPGDGTEARAGAPLSYAQQALWTFEQMVSGSSVYHVPVAYRLTGPLRVDFLRQALTMVIRRHETLRTAFLADAGCPYQVAMDPAEAGLPVHDLSNLRPPDRGRAAAAIVRREARTPFDLCAGRPVRPCLIRLDDAEHILSIVLHHLVCDGWSLRLLADELSAVYRALRRGADPGDALPPLSVQYAQYARWQRQWLTGPALSELLSHWTDVLAGARPPDLTGGRPAPRRPSFDADRLLVQVDTAVCAALLDQARAARTSLFGLLATAFTAALSSRTRQTDIVFGTFLTGRIEPELEGLIGYFVNMVVLRADVTGDPAWRLLARQLAASMLAAIDHEAPFSLVVERLAPARRGTRNPLTQVAMQLLSERSAPTALDLPGVTATREDVYQGQQGFDLLVTFTEYGNALELSVEYSTQAFTQDWATDLAAHICRILGAGAAAPQAGLSQILAMAEWPRRRSAGASAVTVPREAEHGEPR